MMYMSKTTHLQCRVCVCECTIPPPKSNLTLLPPQSQTAHTVVNELERGSERQRVEEQKHHRAEEPYASKKNQHTKKKAKTD